MIKLYYPTVLHEFFFKCKNSTDRARTAGRLLKGNIMFPQRYISTENLKLGDFVIFKSRKLEIVLYISPLDILLRNSLGDNMLICDTVAICQVQSKDQLTI